MKRRKLVGITLIVVSILLQVGYATTSGQNTHMVNTEVFKVGFQDDPSIKHDAEMDVTAEVGKGIVTINVSNLYPGGQFEVIPSIKNSGELDATITQVQFVETQGEGYSHELFEALVGYSQGQTVSDYSAYLSDIYLGQVIKADDTLTIPLALGLDPKETGLQNERMQFSLVLQFSQKEIDNGGGENGGSGGGKDPSTETEEVDKEILEKPIVNPKEPIVNPNEEIPLPEEEIPLVEILIPEEEIDVIEKQDLETSVLPKTGGITPILVYGLGIALLGSGIMIYRKKDE